MNKFYKEAMEAAASEKFLPVILNSRVRRGGGYGHGCSSGLGIFNFLLFLVVLAGLLATLANDAMVNIMINGQNVSLFQVDRYNTVFLHHFFQFSGTTFGFPWRWFQ